MVYCTTESISVNFKSRSDILQTKRRWIEVVQTGALLFNFRELVSPFLQSFDHFWIIVLQSWLTKYFSSYGSDFAIFDLLKKIHC